jgi:hypothetical protein
MSKEALSRRTFWTLASLTAACSKTMTASPTQTAAVPDTFPTQPPSLAREVVTVSHFGLKRVTELVEGRPSLARAAWDWGFGDSETALGAASHTGNREIATYLIDHGARPTLFSAAMLGQVDVVKAFVSAHPGVQRIPGPHSISLLEHAQAGGPTADPVLRYLESLGDAGAPVLPPIGAEELSSLTGTYTFGIGPTEQIEIALNKGLLMFIHAHGHYGAPTAARGRSHLPSTASERRADPLRRP